MTSCFHFSENHTIAPQVFFSRKRGRPKKNHTGRDTGTPELVMKRVLGQTTEILDLYLKKDRITPDQHWCGIHIRWLYTLRFGVPTVKSIDTTDLGGLEIKSEDQQWSQAREAEYKQAIELLSREKLHREVISVCVHNEYPHHLRTHNLAESVSNGLELLCGMWIYK